MKRLITLSLGDLQKALDPSVKDRGWLWYGSWASVDDGQTVNLSRECVDENL